MLQQCFLYNSQTYGALDTANTPGAAVVRNADASINVGEVNCAGINNTSGDYQPITTSAKTTTYAVGVNDKTVTCNATAGAFAVTLPAVAANTNRIITVKKTDSSGNAVTVTGNGSETIDGSNTHALSAQYSTVTVQSDGATWQILSKI
jgi:hypothetical protein